MDQQNSKFPESFLKHILTVKNKRANIVINHVMKHGFITTEELENTYGYSHPPRAARDVREVGIPLITYSIKSANGKSIAAYKFGDLENIQAERSSGRINFPKKFKFLMLTRYGGRCSICNGDYEDRYLQIDHRVPYQIAGDLSKELNIEDFLLLCGSCNRSKSWSCEHCSNWTTLKKPENCQNCYWGDPINYTHIALENVRRIDVLFTHDEVSQYDSLKNQAEENGITVVELLKKLVKNQFSK